MSQSDLPVSRYLRGTWQLCSCRMTLLIFESDLNFYYPWRSKWVHRYLCFRKRFTQSVLKWSVQQLTLNTTLYIIVAFRPRDPVIRHWDLKVRVRVAYFKNCRLTAFLFTFRQELWEGLSKQFFQSWSKDRALFNIRNCWLFWIEQGRL